MSKMPAKKKSCFQITSVTTAQVASSITEDTESLDDPDESRTEDVSSEIFDVSRATDYGPEDVCERSSSEETLNNVGQIDDTRRKSEPLPQPPLSLIAENKPHVKPPVPDTLTNPLHLPASTPMNSFASSVFGISIPVDGDEDSASGASVVAIDNKIEQAMDLVKSHLMYAVREEVEVLKEQIKELVERNSLLERENALLKSLSNNDQLSQLSTQQANPSSTSQPQTVIAQPPQPTQPPQKPNVSSA
ncbi:TSC22 domain family protein 2 [Alligator mississippiensis]|uniref:TSC22 domain family protein 2 n=1 Tax=Alligator mississippiensis TaxID=8496 RepID=A0A151NAV6_ALLMI|nr:TSC22 domain family protein 2 [Alligator mississippiensis]